MTYDSWKLATPPEYEEDGPLKPENDFYAYIDRLEEVAQTPEDEARIEALIRAYENKNGPRHDGWEHVEFPFAENH